jgi:hypothetical protein
MGNSYFFEGMEFSEDVEKVQIVLWNRIISNGFEEIVWLPQFLESDMRETVTKEREYRKYAEMAEPLPGVVPMPEVEVARIESMIGTIPPIVKKELDRIDAERIRFTEEFENLARNLASVALEESREHVVAEANRYGFHTVLIPIASRGMQRHGNP